MHKFFVSTLLCKNKQKQKQLKNLRHQQQQQQHRKMTLIERLNLNPNKWLFEVIIKYS